MKPSAEPAEPAETGGRAGIIGYPTDFRGR